MLSAINSLILWLDLHDPIRGYCDQDIVVAGLWICIQGTRLFFCWFVICLLVVIVVAFPVVLLVIGSTSYAHFPGFLSVANIFNN